MVGHTFLYSPAVKKIKEIVQCDIGEIRYICARRLKLGLFQKDINVAWDLAPMILPLFCTSWKGRRSPSTARGSAHITPGVEDVTTIWLNFPGDRSAIIQSSWLDPRKIREIDHCGQPKK